MKRKLALAASAALLTSFAFGPASAHVTIEKTSAPVGSFYKAVFTVPHGCDGSPTVKIAIQIPEGVISVKPMVKAGWSIDVKRGDYAKPYSFLHGAKMTQGPKEVTFTGATLPDAYYDEFVVVGTLAGVEPGQTLYFDTVQSCGEETVSWSDHPTEEETGGHPAHPAPALTIVAGSGGGHMDHMDMGGMHGMNGTASPAGQAHGPDAAAEAGELSVTEPWIKAMLPGQKVGGGYLVITNGGKTADRLVSIASPAAEVVELHEMSMANDVMKMRKVEGGLAVPAGKTVALEPGGYHLMFKGVKQPFEAGATVPVTLTFEKAGSVELQVPVLPANARSYEDGAKKDGGN